MKLNKICLYLSNSMILFFILIIVVIYIYKNHKEGFARLGNLRNQPNPNPTNPIGLPKPYDPLPLPPSIHSCDMMTSYGVENCNKAITTSNIRCGWNNKVKNSMGGICEGI